MKSEIPFIKIRDLERIPPEELSIWKGYVFPCSELDELILKEYEDAEIHRQYSHPVNGRWENEYYPKAHASVTVSLIEQIMMTASSVIGKKLKLVHNSSNTEGNSWWINSAATGEKTSVHDHSVHAAMSGVYYLKIPERSGHIVFHPNEGEEFDIKPAAGLFLLFPPRLKHSVQVNRSGNNRVSLAFNFYPASA